MKPPRSRDSSRLVCHPEEVESSAKRATPDERPLLWLWLQLQRSPPVVRATARYKSRNFATDHGLRYSRLPRRPPPRPGLGSLFHASTVPRRFPGCELWQQRQQPSTSVHRHRRRFQRRPGFVHRNRNLQRVPDHGDPAAYQLVHSGSIRRLFVDDSAF